jgi:starch phosphorylase
MVGEYLATFYLPASRQGRRYTENGMDAARRIAAWKSRVRKAWDTVRIRRLDTPRRSISFGESMRFEVAVFLDGLKPEDVVVEMLIGRQTESVRLREGRRYRFEWEGIMTEQGEHRFVLQLTPEICGKLEYRVRVYPWHENLTQPFEMGMLRWL